MKAQGNAIWIVVTAAILAVGLLVYLRIANMARNHISEPNITNGKMEITEKSLDIKQRNNLYDYDINLQITYNSPVETVAVPVVYYKTQYFKCVPSGGKVHIKKGENKIDCHIKFTTDFSPVFKCSSYLMRHESMNCNGIVVTLYGITDIDHANEDSKSSHTSLKLADFIGISGKMREVLGLKKYFVLLVLNSGAGDVPISINLDRGCKQAESPGYVEGIDMYSGTYGKTKLEVGGCYFCNNRCGFDTDDTCNIERIGQGEFYNGFKRVMLTSGEAAIQINSILIDNVMFARLASTLTGGLVNPHHFHLIGIENMEIKGRGNVAGGSSPLLVSLYPATCDFLNGAATSDAIHEAISRCGLNALDSKIIQIGESAEKFGIKHPVPVRC